MRLGQPLTTNAPIFPGDPPFHWRVWTTVPKSGYLLEQITSLGTHTGTHISAPCHFHVGAPCLVRLPERFFTPRPLVVLDLRAAIRRRNGDGDFFVGISDLRRFEGEHGRIPPGSYVVLYTGLSRFYHLGNARRPGPYNDYFDDVPGFSGAAVDWLFDQRHILGVGADTFGPGRDVRCELRRDDRGDRPRRDHAREHGRGPRVDAGVRRLDRAERPALHDQAARRRAPRVQRRADGDDRLHRLAVASPGGVSVD